MTAATNIPLQSLDLSADERQSGVLSAEHQALSAYLLACRGYVILRNALRLEVVDDLRNEMTAILADCRRTMDAAETGSDSNYKVKVGREKGAAFWFRKSRWRIFPRLQGPFANPELLANPFVVSVLGGMLGPDFYCKSVSSDTCIKGAILQSPHSDIDGNEVMIGNRWKPRGYIVNVPVMECGLHNGPIEVWPGGSHMWTSDLMARLGLSPDVQDGRNPPVERAAEYLQSIKLALQPGEILIRDLAMWHRGTPNPTEEPRTMLTSAFFRRDHSYGYGDAAHNVDEALFAKLHPRIQEMFAYHFTLRSKLRRKLRPLKAAARTKARRWLARGEA